MKTTFWTEGYLSYFICLDIFSLFSSLELPYVTPLENKQRKSFTSKALYPLSNIPKNRPVQKQRREFLCVSSELNPLRLYDKLCDTFVSTVEGKLEETRPSLFSKLFTSGSVPELGHSSSSEGEKEFASPEWDVPLSKNSVRKLKI